MSPLQNRLVMAGNHCPKCAQPLPVSMRQVELVGICPYCDVVIEIVPSKYLLLGFQLKVVTEERLRGLDEAVAVALRIDPSASTI